MQCEEGWLEWLKIIVKPKRRKVKPLRKYAKRNKLLISNKKLAIHESNMVEKSQLRILMYSKTTRKKKGIKGLS
jgi:hypothetical protein